MKISKRKLWGFQKITYNLSKARFWQKVNFFDQFYESKSRHLSSEPLTALKKRVI